MLAQALFPGWSIGSVFILVIVIAACIAITGVALKYFNITVPSWATSIFWIIVVAAVAILAIRFVTGV